MPPPSVRVRVPGCCNSARVAAFARVAGRLNTLDLIVFMLSMRINRAERKVFFACWPLDLAAESGLYPLARVARAHGVGLEHDERTTGFS